MNTRREHPTHTTGAHPAHRGTHRTAPRPGESPDLCMDHLDGLFTYCLSVMCEHEAAVAVLGEALAVADRRRRRGRAPADTALHRAWLYALARWTCLRRLAERPGLPEPAEATGPLATERRRELASLAWPEAAGTGPEQREALELAVRHQLPVHEVAAVLGLGHDAAGLLLSSGACEVERTRTALAVVDRGGCPAVARLAEGREMLLDSTLSRELVRHVDECGECRRTAERVLAGGPWPGTAPADAGALTVLRAPVEEVRAATLAAQRARSRRVPRFDRRGFPAGPGGRAEHFARLRRRAAVAVVVAALVTAPALALWTAYRGTPEDGGPGGTQVSAAERGGSGGRHGAPHGDGGRPGSDTLRDGSGGVRVDVDVTGVDGRKGSAGGPDRPGGPEGPGEGEAPGRDDRTGPGRLTVGARPAGGATLVVLTASGGERVRWTARTDASWLRLSRTRGTLRPGESVTVTVTVDRGREPAGAWSARIAVDPAKAVVTLRGQGSRGEGDAPAPAEEPPAEPEPTREPAEEPPAEPPAEPSDPPPAEPSAPLPGEAGPGPGQQG
ncbi:sigma-70 family RNA polymerase sigma factor [Streptomyces sp. TRM 70361]|uniref:BACON domain-containing protein n=1 Tax=Streptomyces sp. TRM 70361 TaxID=3116553 RepID=UPI002E7AB51E|nr:sigma-70 family RNA polymerase sigma factor [Streptomyces sp. TRM 70361]MEE1942615.1 sigma-70 family RNA polymerase sigma factor [Streptomyces sp. TRM 70361]